jgi:hypothetical protein
VSDEKEILMECVQKRMAEDMNISNELPNKVRLIVLRWGKLQCVFFPVGLKWTEIQWREKC